MNVKKLLFAVYLTLFVSTLSIAQYNTGDNQLNASLVKIDANAQGNFSAFRKDMSSSYNVSEGKIDSWSVTFGMKAGDIYLTLEIGRITKRPVEEVIDVFKHSKKKGWGAMAKELGIKPGSAEFHALKNGADSMGQSKGQGQAKSKGGANKSSQKKKTK